MNKSLPAKVTPGNRALLGTGHNPWKIMGIFLPNIHRGHFADPTFFHRPPEGTESRNPFLELSWCRASAQLRRVPPQDSETARWFAEEVQPHESILRSYLRRKFPGLQDVDDVVQESFLKILKARIDGKLRSARGFLFTAARNAALDGFRRRRPEYHETIGEDLPLCVLEDSPGVAEIVSLEQELNLLAEAIEALPLRCRQVLKLRKIYGLSHKEIAIQLGISERTVNVQVGLGVRRCAAYFRSQGALTALASSTEDAS